jgi:hypothetical protein
VCEEVPVPVKVAVEVGVSVMAALRVPDGVFVVVVVLVWNPDGVRLFVTLVV